MVSVLISSESLELSSAEAVVREHTVDSDSHSSVSLVSHKILIGDRLQTTDPACVPVVVLLLKLLTCQDSLFAVDDDNVVAAVYVRSVGGLMLTSEDVSSLSSNTAERLTLCVEDIPGTVYFSGFSSPCCPSPW